MNCPKCEDNYGIQNVLDYDGYDDEIYCDYCKSTYRYIEGSNCKKL